MQRKKRERGKKATCHLFISYKDYSCWRQRQISQTVWRVNGHVWMVEFVAPPRGEALQGRLCAAFFLVSWRAQCVWVSELFLFWFLFSTQRLSTVAFKSGSNAPREKWRYLTPNCSLTFQTAYKRSVVSYILSIFWSPDSSSVDSLILNKINQPNNLCNFFRIGWPRSNLVVLKRALPGACAHCVGDLCWTAHKGLTLYFSHSFWRMGQAKHTRHKWTLHQV